MLSPLAASLRDDSKPVTAIDPPRVARQRLRECGYCAAGVWDEPRANEPTTGECLPDGMRIVNKPIVLPSIRADNLPDSRVCAPKQDVGSAASLGQSNFSPALNGCS